jgi:predicted ATPase
LFYQGEFAAAHAYWEQSIVPYNPQQHRSHIALFGVDIGVVCLSVMSHTLWLMGYPDQALSKSHEALTLAEELCHPFSLAVAHAYATMLHQFRRAPHAALERAEATIALCAEQGFAYYLAWGQIMQRWARVAQGYGQEGKTQIQEGISALQATGARLRLPYYRTLLADAYGQEGQVSEGLTVIAEARVNARKERWWEAEMSRLEGELLQQAQGEGQEAEYTPEACFQQALVLARQQQSKLLELRTTISLARLWWSQGKSKDAIGSLHPQ